MRKGMRGGELYLSLNMQILSPPPPPKNPKTKTKIKAKAKKRTNIEDSSLLTRPYILHTLHLEAEPVPLPSSAL